MDCVRILRAGVCICKVSGLGNLIQENCWPSFTVMMFLIFVTVKFCIEEFLMNYCCQLILKPIRFYFLIKSKKDRMLCFSIAASMLNGSLVRYSFKFPRMEQFLCIPECTLVLQVFKKEFSAVIQHLTWPTDYHLAMAVSKIKDEGAPLYSLFKSTKSDVCSWKYFR